ncbi:hypothetical protein GCM10023149_08530 [Mucilaginibacter gynuensis]|uniref:IPT/TIG domain-containing protein n=1 Tax=Mucilaginibacter gynuensis TaxID=1302236 RepID=A0ABP8FXC0_9SPHI
MKKILYLFVFTLTVFTSCKKDKAGEPDLGLHGYGPMSFATGDVISIYGNGFDSNPQNNKVTFNGVPGEVATATPNRLQVIVPAIASNGTIKVQVGGKTVISDLAYSLLTVLQGTIVDNTILTADKKYLLRGEVIFNNKLIIQAGTVILGEKLTHASVTASDIGIEGTADKPVIFTSDQPVNSRQPGDWGGVTIKAGERSLPNGILKYMRVEYAGYHASGKTGVALALNMDASSTYSNIQVSYSQGDAFNINSVVEYTGSDVEYALGRYFVAFACAGTDFKINGPYIVLQYALGLKDPYNADVSLGQGIFVMGAPVRLSNITLIGYYPSARGIKSISPGYPLSNNAGRGVQIGGYSNLTNGTGYYIPNTSKVSLYNSVIAGSWLSGVSIFGRDTWNNYAQPSIYGAIDLFNNYITGGAPAQYPFRGGAFSLENATSPGSGFENIRNDAKNTRFAADNDTTKMLQPDAGKDDLGIAGLANYNMLGHPNLLPKTGSVLLQGAKFPSGSPVDIPLINKDIKFVGAFGTEDWTAGWCNFNPQITKY